MEPCSHPRLSIVQGVAKCDDCEASWKQEGSNHECLHRWVQDNYTHTIYCSFCGDEPDSASEESK